MACSLAALIRKRGLRPWRGCGGRSNWRLARRIWRRCARLPAREPSRRDGSSGRGWCWPTGKTPRSLRWVALWGCIIRRLSAVSSGRWPMVQWRRSTIVRDRARSRLSPPRPRHGWCLSPAARRRTWARSTLSSRTATKSREFIEFLKLLDAAYPSHTAIKLILDNHSAHISKETKAWLAEQPTGRFEFTFTPKHGSWLNLVEGFFSKLAR